MRYDFVVVGMGSGGISAAEFAASLGLRVAVVERDRIGGDCLWTGCVPSKALLASARAAHAMRTAGALGVRPVEPEVDLEAVWRRIRAIQDEIAASDDDPARYEALGIELVAGEARLAGPTTVAVGDRVLETRYVLLCTGSRPAVPSVPGLEQAGYVTSESLFELRRVPRSVAVIGGGPIGAEMAQGLRRLGLAVTLLQRGPRLLPRDEPELADLLAGTLAAERGPRGILVDGRMRSNVPTVYAAGDAAGRFLFTHSAGHEAVHAVRDMFFPGRGRAPELVPWCTFTDPELAHAGLTISEARERHGDVGVHRIDLARSDRGRAEGASGRIVLVTARDRLVGAHILAPGAGELIHEPLLAIERGLRLRDLAGTVHVYPTLSTELGRLAADAAYAHAGRYRRLLRRAA